MGLQLILFFITAIQIEQSLARHYIEPIIREDILSSSEVNRITSYASLTSPAVDFSSYHITPRRPLQYAPLVSVPITSNNVDRQEEYDEINTSFESLEQKEKNNKHLEPKIEGSESHTTRKEAYRSFILGYNIVEKDYLKPIVRTSARPNRNKITKLRCKNSMKSDVTEKYSINKMYQTTVLPYSYPTMMQNGYKYFRFVEPQTEKITSTMPPVTERYESPTLYTISNKEARPVMGGYPETSTTIPKIESKATPDGKEKIMAHYPIRPKTPTIHLNIRRVYGKHETENQPFVNIKSIVNLKFNHRRVSQGFLKKVENPYKITVLYPIQDLKRNYF